MHPQAGPAWRLSGALAVVGLFTMAVSFGLQASPTTPTNHPAPSASGLLDFSAEEHARILAHGPWPATPTVDASNRVHNNPAAAAWGLQLFSDQRLSSDGSLSCASCHQPEAAFQDGLPTALGRVPAERNTPSLLGIAQQRWWGWGGRHDSLWSASLSPMLAGHELAQTPAGLLRLMRSQPDLAKAYAQVFQQPVPASGQQLAVDLAKVLAAYQATLELPRTAFDDFRDALQRGDKVAASLYPLAAQRGLKLFVGQGNCHVCHASPGFSNGEFADIGIPFFVPSGVDPGRHQGLQQLLASPFNRLGPFNDAVNHDSANASTKRGIDPAAVSTRHVNIEPRHFGEFRVPTLRGLVATAPYMHNGSLASLHDVVQHYSQLNEDRLHADGERILKRLDLSAEQAADLEAFLRSLSPNQLSAKQKRPAGQRRPCNGQPPKMATAKTYAIA